SSSLRMPETNTAACSSSWTKVSTTLSSGIGAPRCRVLSRILPSRWRVSPRESSAMFDSTSSGSVTTSYSSWPILSVKVRMSASCLWGQGTGVHLLEDDWLLRAGADRLLLGLDLVVARADPHHLVVLVGSAIVMSLPSGARAALAGWEAHLASTAGALTSVGDDLGPVARQVPLGAGGVLPGHWSRPRVEPGSARRRRAPGGGPRCDRRGGRPAG